MKREGHMKTKVDIGVMRLQNQELQGFWQQPEARTGKERSSSRVFRGSMALLTT